VNGGGYTACHKLISPEQEDGRHQIKYRKQEQGRNVPSADSKGLPVDQ